jgi:rubrerythrin
MNSRTKANLTASARAEAFAYAAYMLFADHARADGHSELAEVFKMTATQERLEHFADAMHVLGMVHDDLDNLGQAIAGQLSAEAMYRDFAQQAKTDGDAAAVALFSENSRDEAHHRASLEDALRRASR